MSFDRTRTRGVPGVLVALLALLLAAPVLAAPAGAADGDRAQGRSAPGKPLTVMTRNVYLGADIFRPLRAAQEALAGGASPQEAIQAMAVASHETRQVVDQTDFRVRSRLLAGEIAETRPDLVGLQEVALWRQGPLQMDQVGVPNATEVDYDFLAILREDLAEAGAPYDVAVVGQRADVEAPTFDAAMEDARDVRLTMHDVILVRRGTKVVDSGDQQFATNLPVDLAGITLDFSRGYQWVDVRVGPQRVRFVNTHLEAASSGVALAQAQELVQGAAVPDRTTIVACDCNSDPLDDSTKPGDPTPHSAAYGFLTGPAGFTDQWLEWAPADQGWTAGLSETLDDPTPAGLDHRIDLVLARTPDGRPLAVDRGEITGDELSDRDPGTGLWPSDHAGVVLRLRGL